MSNHRIEFVQHDPNFGQSGNKRSKRNDGRPRNILYESVVHCDDEKPIRSTVITYNKQASCMADHTYVQKASPVVKMEPEATCAESNTLRYGTNKNTVPNDNAKASGSTYTITFNNTAGGSTDHTYVKKIETSLKHPFEATITIISEDAPRDTFETSAAHDNRASGSRTTTSHFSANRPSDHTYAQKQSTVIIAPQHKPHDEDDDETSLNSMANRLTIRSPARGKKLCSKTKKEEPEIIYIDLTESDTEDMAETEDKDASTPDGPPTYSEEIIISDDEEVVTEKPGHAVGVSASRDNVLDLGELKSLQRSILNPPDAIASTSGLSCPIDNSSAVGYLYQPLSHSDDSTDEDVDVSEDRPNEHIFEIPSVLLKEKPKNNYNIVKEIMNREIGISLSREKIARQTTSFPQKFHSSLHAAYKLDKVFNLQKHTSRINSLNFNPEGELLVSSSNDNNVIVWNWARKTPIQVISKLHTSNILQTKFMYLNSGTEINMVTAGLDGHVKIVHCDAAGATRMGRDVIVHKKPILRLYVTPHEPYSVFSAGNDGVVSHADVRSNFFHRVVTIRSTSFPKGINSVHGHPHNAMQLVVGATDSTVRVYDRRRSKKPMALYKPAHFIKVSDDFDDEVRQFPPALTSAIYNHDGTEIMASYNGGDIYLFDVKTDVYKRRQRPVNERGFSYRYNGHWNNSTHKPPMFYGPKSDYIISGSKCGRIYMWDKNTESVIQWLQGDMNGSICVVEPHPRYPVLATGGMDRHIKIWMPNGHVDPSFVGLEKSVRSNSQAYERSMAVDKFLVKFFKIWAARNRSFKFGAPFETLMSHYVHY